MIILFGGEKGGTGKTTLSVNSAVERMRQERDVLLICADKQGSAAAWCAIGLRDTELPRITCVSLYGDGLAEQVLRLARRFDDVVIDTGGRDSPELRSAMTVADRLITPVQTSQFDYFAMAATNSILPAARALNRKLDACIVINRAPTHACSNEARTLRDDLAEFAEYRLFDTQIHERRAYRRIAESGSSISELSPRDEKAEFEVRRFAAEAWA